VVYIYKWVNDYINQNLRRCAVKRGFTLMELIVVVIIIGILAMIGLPQFFRVAERGRAAEGVVALGALRSSQIRYAAEHGLTTGNADQLDMRAVNFRFFANAVPVTGIDPNTGNTTAVLGSITRNTRDNSGFGAYVLSIQNDGTILCGSGNQNICDVLGYGSGGTGPSTGD
jgi:prepilin-type N-terminal cleavage/methylation domain-containing protein